MATNAEGYLPTHRASQEDVGPCVPCAVDADRDPTLSRWRRRRGSPRCLVCVGDSLTAGVVGSPVVTWADQLLAALEPSSEPVIGFRSVWRKSEWTETGSWTRTTPIDEFDVGPFSLGCFTAGSVNDVMTWHKPQNVHVNSFELYWFDFPGVGDWQLSVDEGPWTAVPSHAGARQSALRCSVVRSPITSCVRIRGFDGRRPCGASIIGITPWPGPEPAWERTTIHNLGVPRELLWKFTRNSNGDPFAVLECLRPHLVTVMFTNDAALNNPMKFDADLRLLLEHVRAESDVLFICPPESQPGRQICDGVLTSGSPLLRSARAQFVPGDATRAVVGNDVPDGTTVQYVLNGDVVSLTNPALTDTTTSELTIGQPRTPAMQAEHRAVTHGVARDYGGAVLDIYEDWAGVAGPGWEAASRHGLMADGMHPSQTGHNDIAERILALVDPDEGCLR
jgi:hypothetical protein